MKFKGSLSEVDKKYSIILADPPWAYYGDTQKDQAAGKHYNMMSEDELKALPVNNIADKPCVLFMWATGPKLDQAFRVAESWGFHYRGMAYVWVKTRKSDNKPLGAAGVRPSFVKPTTEFVLVFSTKKKGRPFKLLTEKQSQLVFAPITTHSKKPRDIHKRIVELLGDLPRIELFARQSEEGFDTWGIEADKFDNAETQENTANIPTMSESEHATGIPAENTLIRVP